MKTNKTADTTPIVASEGGAAAAPAKVKKTRAPRASSSTSVTHKHKKAPVAAISVEPVAMETAVVSEPTHEEIAKLAYSYWEARGYQGGSQEDDWLRAVSELRNR